MRCALFADLTPLTLYRILRLREAVFTVEQGCVYTDIDGRDHEPETWHLWVDAAARPTVTACARLLTQPDGSRKLGRVATAADARGAGIAGAVIDAALALVPPGSATVLDAQVRLAGWYGRWGFTRAGADFDEAGIMHTPMRRA
ncbi:MAG: GNAT family N-acetyltransferase [Acidimicrobiales bacterium]